MKPKQQGVSKAQMEVLRRLCQNERDMSGGAVRVRLFSSHKIASLRVLYRLGYVARDTSNEYTECYELTPAGRALVEVRRGK